MPIVLTEDIGRVLKQILDRRCGKATGQIRETLGALALGYYYSEWKAPFSDEPAGYGDGLEAFRALFFVRDLVSGYRVAKPVN